MAALTNTTRLHMQRRHVDTLVSCDSSQQLDNLHRMLGTLENQVAHLRDKYVRLAALTVHDLKEHEEGYHQRWIGPEGRRQRHDRGPSDHQP